MEPLDRSDHSPVIAELLEDAYIAPLSVEAAARHLWSIHKTAEQVAAERSTAATDATAGSEAGTDAVDRRRVLVPSLAGRVPRAAIPLLVVMMLMSSSGMALAASRNSLPGDVLYPVKRGSESAQLIFARSPEARAQLQLAFARARLEEIRRIGITRPQHVPSLVTAIAVSLSEVEQNAPEVAPASQQLREETTEQIAAMRLPGEVVVAVDAALASAPTVDVASTSTTATTSTATEVPQSGSSTTTEPAGVSDADSGVTQGVTAVATPSTTPTPSSSPSASPSGSPSATTSTSATPSSSPSTAADDEQVAADEEDGQPAGAPGAAVGGTDGGATGGQVVTPRPQPSGEGGESRADDGSDAPPTTEPAAGGSETASPEPEGSADSEQPVEPYTRAQPE